MKKRTLAYVLFRFSSGDRTRTCDLWVMSPTSYQLLHPAMYVRFHNLCVIKIVRKSIRVAVKKQDMHEILQKQCKTPIYGNIRRPVRYQVLT